MTRVLFLLSALLPSILFADSLPPMIIHQPPIKAREGSSVTLQAQVFDNKSVAQVLFYFKHADEKTYRIIVPQKRAKTYAVLLSGQHLRPPYVEYYWQATDKSGNSSTLPKVAPTVNPFHLPVVQFLPKKKKLPAPAALRSGNLQVTIESAQSEFPTNPSELPLALIRRRPGKHVQYNLNYFVNRGKNFKSYWLFREEEDFTNRKFDKFRFREEDVSFERTLGDFFLTTSDLGVNNVELRGIAIKQKGSGSITVFGGRSQIPQEEDEQTSAVFRQFLFGLEKQGVWSDEGYWKVHFSHTADQKGSIATPTDTTIRPAQNTLATLSFKRDWKNFSFQSETGLNQFDNDIEDTKPAENDYAAIGILTYRQKGFMLEAMGRRIGANYVTGGALENFVDNDRLGYKFSGEFKMLRGAALRLSREKYENNLDSSQDTTTATEDQNSTLSIEVPHWPAAALSLSRLIQDDLQEDANDTRLRSKSLSLRHTIESFAFLGVTSLSYMWQSLDFCQSFACDQLAFNIQSQSASLDTAYKDILSLSTNFQFTRTREEDATSFAITREKILNTNLQWNVIPFELNIFFNVSISRSKRTDETVDQKEKAYSIAYVYFLSDTDQITLEGKIVNYDDFADPNNTYKNKIFTVKWLKSF